MRAGYIQSAGLTTGGEEKVEQWSSGADKLLLECECYLGLSPAAPELLAHKTEFV